MKRVTTISQKINDKNIIKSHSLVSLQLCKTIETKSFETFVSKLLLQNMFYYHKHDYLNYYVNLMWYIFCPQKDPGRCLYFGLYDMCIYIPLNLGLTNCTTLFHIEKFKCFPFECYYFIIHTYNFIIATVLCGFFILCFYLLKC